MQKEFDRNNDNTTKSSVSDAQILKEIEAMKSKSTDKDKVLEDLKDKEFVHKKSVVELASERNKEVDFTEYVEPTLENGTKLYNGTELGFEKKVLKKMIIWFSVISIIFLAIVLTLFAISTTLPYKDKLFTVFEIIDIVLSVIYGCLAYGFFATFFRKQRCYVKMLNHLESGLLNKTEGIFVFSDKEIATREGVEFYTLTFSVLNKIKDEYFEQKVFVDREKPLPNFEENDKVLFITQGSILVEYQKI